MKRIIKNLNEMSFDLPDEWIESKDKYSLENGQGFINECNYVSKKGNVISLFAIYRDAEEFLKNYSKLVKDYNAQKDGLVLEKKFSLTFNDFVFPTYIIRGCKDKKIFILQSFVNCGDRLGCFMLFLDSFEGDIRQLNKQSETFHTLVNILRTIE